MSFAGETRERSRPVLPLAAMVDVLFLLLIFFMTASAFREQELTIDVSLAPSQTAEASAGSVTQIIISFDPQGQIFLGPRQMTIAELRQTLEALAKDYPNETVIIRGDQEGQFGQAITLMDVAREAGFVNVELATVRPMQE